MKAGYPPEDTLDEADLAAAKWAWENDRAAGRGSDTLPGAKRLFLPMRTGRGAIGVIGIDSDKAGPLLTPDQRRLLDALMDQGALAIERVQLVEDMDRVERTAETERLRSALLTSISHDLKTPLASVLGSAGTLRDLADKLSDGEKAELLATIIDESERLNRFIANLLDMTKLESGAVAPKLAPHDLVEIVGSTLRRASQNSVRDIHVQLDLAADVPMLDARCRAVRAGAVQSARQRREIRRRRHDHPHSAAGAIGNSVCLQSPRRRRRHSAGRPRAHLRQVLPRAEDRPGSARHRPWTRHLARLRRSHARHHRRGEPARPPRRRVHDQLPIPRERQRLDAAA